MQQIGTKMSFPSVDCLMMILQAFAVAGLENESASKAATTIAILLVQ